jgi:hypothetical protein
MIFSYISQLDFDGQVLVGVENAVEAGVLAGGEQLQAGANDAADPIERIAGMSGPPQGVLLDALADQVQLGRGQSHHTEWVHHQSASGTATAAAVL